MSALGHKQTYAVHNGMSDLPPKANTRRCDQVCRAFDRVNWGTTNLSASSSSVSFRPSALPSQPGSLPRMHA